MIAPLGMAPALTTVQVQHCPLYIAGSTAALKAMLAVVCVQRATDSSLWFEYQLWAASLLPVRQAVLACHYEACMALS